MFFLALVPIIALADKNHCTKQEQVIFSCAIVKSPKILSLCASKQLSKKLSKQTTKEQGSLIYRFGAYKKVELAFPSVRSNSLQAFAYAHYFRSQVDLTEVTFLNQGFRYTIFDYYDAEQKPENARGVSIKHVGDADGNETELLCDKNAQSKLQTLDGIIPCNTGSALASCHLAQ